MRLSLELDFTDWYAIVSSLGVFALMSAFDIRPGNLCDLPFTFEMSDSSGRSEFSALLLACSCKYLRNDPHELRMVGF